MRKFTDKSGREWNLAITLGAMDRVRTATSGQWDLMHPERPIDLEGREIPFEVAVRFDLVVAYRLVAMMLDPDLQARGITPADFAESLEGPELLALQDAIFLEWRDFFPKIQRPDLAKLLEKTQAWFELARTAILERTRALDLSAIDDQVIRALMRTTTDRETISTPGSTAGD